MIQSQDFKDASGAVSIFNGDVVKSNLAIPKDFQESLKAAARKLEDIPEASKDYLPSSDEKDLDLVHSSLFPFMYGRSRALEDSLVAPGEYLDAIGKGIVLPIRQLKRL